MSEYKKKIIELIESNLTGYEISKKTGVSQYVLSQLRQGKREVDNLTLNTTEKLYEYANNSTFQFVKKEYVVSFRIYYTKLASNKGK